MVRAPEKALKCCMTAPDKAAVLFYISTDIDVAIAVSNIRRLELLADFPPAVCSLLATVVSELANNILKYAQRGTIQLIRLEAPTRYGVEIMASDVGPGIPDLAMAMRDHYSTGGTLGLGLPGVRRMMDEFQIWSAPNQGARVTTRKWHLRHLEI